MVSRPRAFIRHGDCLDVLKALKSESFDSIVTDPPYELGFMGKAWDASGIAYSVEMWIECLRVLKPGGHLLAFGGTRTYHRMACAIEDAGFEVRDSIHWIYGTGFPKSLDVSKAIDKAAGADREVVGRYQPPSGVAWNLANDTARAEVGAIGHSSRAESLNITAPTTDDAVTWQGWGTALKPAHEPIIVARKPLIGTVVANVLAHGTGAINVDACRVQGPGADAGRTRHGGGIVGNGSSFEMPDSHGEMPAGRWPANIVLTHSPDCAEACVEGCPVAEMDAQSGTLKSGSRKAGTHGLMGYMGADVAPMPAIVGDSGSASRFFPCFRYEAKASSKERPKVDGVAHPTVKPLALMRWLVRLVTPPGGMVLEPFAGSGTTVEAALLEGFHVAGIERDAAYLPLIQARIDRVRKGDS